MTLNPLSKSLLAFLTLLLGMYSGNAQQVNSLGIFTGITVPYTFDGGINKDARYKIKYSVKYSPVGIHYGVDYEGYGVMFDPCLLRIGQSFNLINIYGGHVGERNIDLSYFYFPVGLKLHLIDLSFFKVSFVASVGFGTLLDGKETIRHQGDIKLKFPLEVINNPTPAQFMLDNPGYLVDYDGVLAPRTNTKLLSKTDYQSFQVFGGIGFRADWDFSQGWRTSMDIRGNIGALEPRKSEYIDKVKANNAVYDIYGARRDLFLSFNIGIARTIEVDHKEREVKMRRKMENKPHRPAKYPWPKPKNKKPKK